MLWGWHVGQQLQSLGIKTADLPAKPDPNMWPLDCSTASLNRIKSPPKEVKTSFRLSHLLIKSFNRFSATPADQAWNLFKTVGRKVAKHCNQQQQHNNTPCTTNPFQTNSPESFWEMRDACWTSEPASEPEFPQIPAQLPGYQRHHSSEHVRTAETVAWLSTKISYFFVPTTSTAIKGFSEGEESLSVASCKIDSNKLFSVCRSTNNHIFIIHYHSPYQITPLISVWDSD